MTYKEIIEKIKPELDKAVSFLEGEMQKIRTGRATPALVENIVVDCFGQKFPLKQLAAISVPEPRTIVVQPWDKSYIEGIVAGLSDSALGAAPIVEKDFVRISMPTLTEEYRKDFLRLLAQKLEETRIVIRKYRDKAWDEIQQGAKEGLIREDDKFRGKDELQKVVDSYNEKIEEMGEKKKKEISE